MIYRFNDIRMSDLKFGTLSLGNIPIKFEQGRVAIEDPNPTATPPTDIDGCDTPNFSLRTCDSTHSERLRSLNHATRRSANTLLIQRLGHRTALAFIQQDDTLSRSMAAFFGRFNAGDIDASNLPPRIRDRNANPFLPTSGDPDFRRRSGSYRRYRRCDSHPQLLDSSWVGPASRHSSEII
jgi:hypothetical protein